MTMIVPALPCGLLDPNAVVTVWYIEARPPPKLIKCAPRGSGRSIA
jgi:hypothetical protein